MNWWLITGSLVIAWIGGTLINDGANSFTKWLGLFVTLACGIVLSFGMGIPERQGYIQPDRNKCSQYVWVDDTLTCVPYGEEG